MRIASRFSIILFVYLLLSNTLSAQDQKPVQIEKFKFSFSERFRIETFDNAIDLNEDGVSNQSYSRNRTSIMGQWFPSSQFEMAAKLTHEFRNYFAPKKDKFYGNEIFFDQLYFKYIKKDGFLPLTFTIGRQNIMLGEGFVVFDGTPLDGSRSAYFNAARFDFFDGAEKLTLFAVRQTREDIILPTLNGKDIDASAQGENSYKLNEQTEIAAGLYFSKDFDKTNFQAYYIWKKIEEDGKKIVPESDIHTAGSRIALPLNVNFSVTAEAAYQFGSSGDADISAYGGYGYLSYKPASKESFLKNISIGSFLLSGDDGSTEEYEGWNPVFGRWPKWSESYVFTSLNENQGRIAYWTNMASIYAKLEMKLSEDVSLILQQHHLLSMEERDSSAFLRGGEKTRGELSIARLDYQVNKFVSGHFVYEHFTPGNFYFEGADSYSWVRFEILYSF